MRAYARAKRWKVHLAAGLADELGPVGVTVNAASPGPAWTPMTQALTRQNLGAPTPLWWLVSAVQRLSSAAHAARCVVRAAVDAALAEPGRRLVHGTRTSRPISVDPEVARRDLVRARASAVTLRRTTDPDSGRR